MSENKSIAAETRRFKHELATAGLTEAGRDWAVLALDPFHDTEIPVVGCPNSQTGRSLVFDIRQTIQVEKPTGHTGNWDCHVALIPSCRMTELPGKNQVYTAVLGVTPQNCNTMGTSITGNDVPEGILVVDAVPASLNTFEPNQTQNEYSAISLDDYLQPNGRHLIVSAGFEVHNTTAEINKQGSVTCYRHQNKYADGFYTDTVVNHLCAAANAPPPTLAQAKALGGVTWEAAEGALVPITYSHADEPPAAFRPIATALMQNTGTMFTNMVAGNAVAPMHMSFGLDSCGAYFTGLSEDTTLEVVLRVVMEVFPEPTSDLMALSKLSPPVDYRAMQMVSHIQQTLKPGYPVSENGFGDFFRGIVGTLSRVVKPAASIIGNLVPKLAKPLHVVEQVADAGIKWSASKKKRMKQQQKRLLQAGGNRIA